MKRAPSTWVLVLALASSPADAASEDRASESSGDGRQARVERVLTKVHGRPLASNSHTPWVIMHGVIAFESALQVHDAAGEQQMNAIDYLLEKATYEGRGIFRETDGVPTLPPRRQYFQVQDHVEDQELGWTLVAMSTYVPRHKSWTTADGRRYRVEDVVALAVERDPRRETEGGPHHLYGVAYALRRYDDRGGPHTGAWAQARAYLDRYVDLARRYQQEDGAFSEVMFRGSRPPHSPRTLVSTTGHLTPHARQHHRPHARMADGRTLPRGSPPGVGGSRGRPTL
jgi:hypothetical protein